MKRYTIDPSELYATNIGPSVQLKGTLRSTLPLDIRGSVSGSIEAGFIRIAPGAVIAASECSVERAAILGRFEGNLRATESIMVLPKANVRAHLKAPRIEIVEGALFEGEIDVDPARNAH